MTDATMKKAAGTTVRTRICAKISRSNHFREIYANELYPIQGGQRLRC